MLTLSFQTTFWAMLQILLMGLCGYILICRRTIDEKGLNLLSGLVVNFFLPAFILDHLLTNFSFNRYPRWWVFPLLSFGVTLSGYIVARIFTSIDKTIQKKKEFTALVAFQNSGYLPLLLVTAIFPEAEVQILYVYIFLFLIGFDLAVWSAGVRLLTAHKLEKWEIKKIFNPPIIAILSSLILVALGLSQYMPKSLAVPLKLFGDCTLPLSMIIVGGNLARVNLRNSNPGHLILVVLAKLVVLPVIALGFLRVVHMDFLTGFLIVLESAVPSAVSLSVIARHSDLEDTFLNQGLVFSHLFSVITIPIFLMIYSAIQGAF